MILAAVSCSDLSDCCDGCSVLVIQLQFCISADNHGTVFVLSDQLTMVDMYIHYWRTYEQSWEADFWNKMTSFFLVWQTCLISWFFFLYALSWLETYTRFQRHGFFCYQISDAHFWLKSVHNHCGDKRVHHHQS